MAYGALLSLPTSQGIRRDVYLDFNAMKFGIQTVRRPIKHFQLHSSLWQLAKSRGTDSNPGSEF